MVQAFSLAIDPLMCGKLDILQKGSEDFVMRAIHRPYPTAEVGQPVNGPLTLGDWAAQHAPLASLVRASRWQFSPPVLFAAPAPDCKK